MRILHSGVFPVGELEKFVRVPGRTVEQEIVRHCVDMCQTPVLGQAFDVGAKCEQILLRLAVIPVDGRIAVPKGFVEVDLAEDVESVVNGQVHGVELAELVHAAAQVVEVVGIAGPDVVEEGRDLVPVLRVDIHGIVAEAEAADRFVDVRLLAAVNQLVGAFAGDPHDVFGALSAEEEASVGHALLQDTDVRDLVFLAVEGRADCLYRVGLEVVGVGIQVAELLVGVDLDEIVAAHYFGLQDHAVLRTGFFACVQCFLPEIFVEGLVGIHSLKVIPDDARLGLGEVGNADHGVAGFPVRDRDELALAVYADCAVLVHKFADHVPGVGLRGGIGVACAPDVAGDNVGVADPVGDQGQGVKVVLRGVIRVDDQIYAVLVHQVFKAFLHKAGDDRDIPDPLLVQLADGPLDQRLAADFNERFGRREVDGDHAHSESGREDDRVPRRPLPDLLPALLSQLSVLVDKSVRGQLLEGSVHYADAQAGRGGQDPLVDEGFKI